MTGTNGRMIAIATLMFLGAGLAAAMKPGQRMADIRGIPKLQSMIPERFGDWKIDNSLRTIEPTPDLKAVIDKVYTDTLSRTYVSTAGQRVMLSVAYGGDQSDNLRVHEPEVCYSVQGFQISGVARRDLRTPGGLLPVKTLVAVNGPRIEPITYWIAVGDMVTLSNFQQKLARVRTGLTGKVADGMLIRVSSMGTADESSYKLHEQFIAALIANLPPTDQARLGLAATHR